MEERKKMMAGGRAPRNSVHRKPSKNPVTPPRLKKNINNQQSSMKPFEIGWNGKTRLKVVVLFLFFRLEDEEEEEEE